MANINPTTFNGWNAWSPVDTVVRPIDDDVENIALADGDFPRNYTPSSAFWASSFLANCLIPWINVLDPFSLFLLAGGSTGTLLGAIGGVFVVNDLLSFFGKTGEFGIGRAQPGPEMGITISDKIKHHAWIHFVVQNVISDVVLLSPPETELIQNSRLKKLYLYQGEVERFVAEGGTNSLSLDINKDLPPANPDAFGGLSIGFIKPDGTTFVRAIESVSDNWLFVLEPPPESEESPSFPSPGDYYKFSDVILIDDPLLLSGNWGGLESDYPDDPSSGLDLYVTSQNKPYYEGKIMGVYILAEDDGIVTDGISASGDRPSLIHAPGVRLNDTIDLEWMWLGFGNSEDFSLIYPDDIRYKKEITEDDDGDEIIEDVPRDAASSGNYDELIENEGTVALRVEISTGGYWYRHNWYAPDLVDEYIENGGKLYKIIGQPTAQIIDVAITSVDGSSRFNPSTNQDYKIINQKGWLMNDYFMGFSNGVQAGLFKGVITEAVFDGDANQSNVTVGVFDENFPTTLVPVASPNQTIQVTKESPPGGSGSGASIAVPNNYSNRFKYKIVRDGPPSQYRKFDGWELWSNDGGTKNNILYAEILDAAPTFTGPVPQISYGMKYLITGEIPSGIVVGTQVFVTAGEAFETYRNTFSKESGFSSIIEVEPALSDDPVIPLFVASDLLCLEGEYRTNPYVVDIVPGDRVGITGGFLFGLEADGSAASRIDQFLFITTPRDERGLSAIFDDLRQEDWVAFADVSTNRMAIRKGSLHFKEFPAKSEVAIGEMTFVKAIDGGDTIDITPEGDETGRLRRLLIEVPEYADGESSSMHFGIGTEENIFGTPIGGDGKVDLQAFRRDGIGPDDLSSSDFQDESGPVSPIVLYKKSSFQNTKRLPVDIAVDTNNVSEIVVIDGEVGDVEAHYVNSDQTIERPKLMDLIRLDDGEVLLLYGKLNVEDFELSDDGGGELVNNSEDEDNKWPNLSAVFMVSTFDDGYFWGTPFVMKAALNESIEFRYPVMLMNSVEYLASIYDRINQTIVIFVRAFTPEEGKPYVGCYRISQHTVGHKLYLCEPEFDTLKFMWRPPLLKDEFMEDEELFWVGEDFIVDDFFTYDSGASAVQPDSFYRILGPESSMSQVAYSGEIGVFTANKLVDGTYVLFYDTEEGVKSLYSTDNARNWASSGLIYARDGRGGFMLGRYFFYISDSGIEIKFTQQTTFSHDRTIATKKAEGIDVSVAEVNSQETLDETNHFPVGTGPIEVQRLSGYITSDGTMKIFFYNGSNRLECIEASDPFSWNIADNF